MLKCHETLKHVFGDVNMNRLHISENNNIALSMSIIKRKVVIFHFWSKFVLVVQKEKLIQRRKR